MPKPEPGPTMIGTWAGNAAAVPSNPARTNSPRARFMAPVLSGQLAFSSPSGREMKLQVLWKIMGCGGRRCKKNERQGGALRIWLPAQREADRSSQPPNAHVFRLAREAKAMVMGELL